MRGINLWSESGDSDTATKQTIRSVIQNDRTCALFTEWHQGFTPKEHQEMMDRKAMLEWQTKREDADKKWRSGQEHYLVKMAGIYAIIAGVVGAGIGAIITWLLTRGHP